MALHQDPLRLPDEGPGLAHAGEVLGGAQGGQRQGDLPHEESQRLVVDAPEGPGDRRVQGEESDVVSARREGQRERRPDP
ncbi:hypothetical protein ASF17_07500 [Frigoribacterium sp. Leaf263]|nr:hypothetical protein ASF17_07500 [Frigoribacterium sp. Leaf263]